MSDPVGQGVNMKYDGVGGWDQRRVELLERFGEAEIIKCSNGKLEIRGGCETERVKAHAWMRAFLELAPLTVRKIG